jgi:diguanylate cyclase (GGDEF)-like protein
MAKLEGLHKYCERKKQSYCIAMIDLDHFKRLNDLTGHTNGDLVLKAFANLAKNVLRSSDVCFRYGGEEFVILLPGTELDDGFTVVERLRKAWAESQLTLPDGQSVHSTVSIGITQYVTNCISFEQMLQASDKALYDAKNAGRNCTVSIQTNHNP